jgi:Domain of unknown function (DUF4062)
MKKRYQVFVSSTFLDLQDERGEIMQALLELRCIPAGMKLFPASNDEQWKLIKRVIDDSDYYVIVIGGRYGSLHSSGISYTEMEYRYALETNKPIIGFLHQDPSQLPAKNCEKDPIGKQKLEDFKSLVQKKMVKYWKNAHDLGSKVSRSIVNLIEDTPAVGWIRADFVPNEEATLQILRLKQKIEELENEAIQTRTSAPKGTEGLSGGDETYGIKFKYSSKDEDYKQYTYTFQYDKSWNAVFSTIRPSMLDEIIDRLLKKELDKMVLGDMGRKMSEDPQHKVHKLGSFEIEEQAFNTIKIQLKALGLIMQSEKKRSVTNQGTYWSLTPYGDATLTQLRAIKK